jgi:hypothetical protein
MSSLRIVLMIVVSAVAVLLVGWGSRAPYQATESEAALLRLSWRMRPERNEQCRDRTQAELDALPVHMRTPRICETSVVPYRLILEIDDGVPDTTVILPAGAKHDRPIYVLRDSLLSPGRHEVEVTFERADSTRATVLRFDQKVNFAAGHIELVTLGNDGRSLIQRSAQ